MKKAPFSDLDDFRFPISRENAKLRLELLPGIFDRLSNVRAGHRIQPDNKVKDWSKYPRPHFLPRRVRG